MDNPLKLKIPVIIKPTDITYQTRAIDNTLLIEIPIVRKNGTIGERWLDLVLEDNPALEDLKSLSCRGYPHNLGVYKAAISVYEYQKKDKIQEKEMVKIESIKGMLETYPKRAKQNPNSMPLFQEHLDRALENHIKTIEHKKSAQTERKPTQLQTDIDKLLDEGKAIHIISKKLECNQTTVRRRKRGRAKNGH